MTGISISSYEGLRRAAEGMGFFLEVPTSSPGEVERAVEVAVLLLDSVALVTSEGQGDPEMNQTLEDGGISGICLEILSVHFRIKVSSNRPPAVVARVLLSFMAKL